MIVAVPVVRTVNVDKKWEENLIRGEFSGKIVPIRDLLKDSRRAKGGAGGRAYVLAVGRDRHGFVLEPPAVAIVVPTDSGVPVASARYRPICCRKPSP